MPFFEAVGQDTRTHQPRSIPISANDERQALFSAASSGLSEPTLRAYTDRELLTMDLKCFLNAADERKAGDPAQKSSNAGVSYRSSLLLDHPILTITCSVLLALMLSRMLDLIVAVL